MTPVRCRWHARVPAAELGADPHAALTTSLSWMPEGADVVLEVAGRLTYADGERVALLLEGARTVEVMAHGPGVAAFVAALRAGLS